MAHKKLDQRLLNLTPRNLFLVTLYGEARGEPIDGQVGVANVIMNRAVGHSHSLVRVLSRWAQFSCLWPTLSSGLGYLNLMDMATVIYDGAIDDLGTQKTLLHQLEWVVDGAMDGHLLDNTMGAKHYFATSIAPPYWAKKPAFRSVTLGHHEFWSGVA